MPEAVIVAIARSPIGRARVGSLCQMRPDDLLADMISAALAKVPELDPTSVDDVMVGCGGTAGEQGFNIARVAAVLAGLDSVPGTTVNRYCSSSLQTTRMAFHAIKAGEGGVFISAGVESLSRPGFAVADDSQYANPRFEAAAARAAQVAQGTTGWSDPREDGALPDVYIAMGQTAENVARYRGITRAEQDEFGVRSQNLAEQAVAAGFWATDITPVTLPDGSIVDRDDSPRPGVTIDAVSALQPVFRPNGTVTAGNCCPLNDGAAAIVIMSDITAKDLGLTPLARIISTGVSGLSPEIMGLGPVAASNQALARAGVSIDDIDLVEINEAFAAQVIPSARDLGVPMEKLNVCGGAIAVGHPFGMTGARITSTLINALRWHDKQYGLETMCVGGGQGMAMVVERLS
ncbi:MAG: acetyl-CoA acetyltransferase [Actinobacteria bacterium 69-20]|nr:acetyl-CoA C-acetyltransferase [Actinomycetota bacterium]OJV29548.1 MAG: acetyl-CoA acetyltransferase [Actinobacteria bacterium 69-20]